MQDTETLTKQKTYIRPVIAIAAVITFSALAGFIVLGQVQNFTGNQTSGDGTTVQAAASDPTTMVDLTWTAPGDDGTTGQATSYDIRYATSTITAGNWGVATSISNPPAPQTAGTAQSMTVSGLQPNTLYYFALKTTDEAGNQSILSNIASKQTTAVSVPPCVENWSCSAWSTCSAGSQSRTCTDAASCPNPSSQPPLTQSCTVPTTNTNSSVNTNTSTGGGGTTSDDVAPNTVLTAVPAASGLITPLFRFTWSGIDDVTAASQLSFAYKLDSGNWSAWTTKQEVTLSKLHNGTHTFSVRSRDAVGNIDASPATTTFTVKLRTFTAVGVEAGAAARIRVMEGKTVKKDFFPYEKTFQGGVSVSVADLGGDGYSELVVGSGSGRVSEVRLFRTDGSRINTFLPFGNAYRDGINVATADVDGNGTQEIIVSQKTRRGIVRIFGYRNGKYTQVAREFDTKFPGVSVAGGDVTNDGKEDVVVMPATTAAPALAVFSLSGNSMVRSALLTTPYNPRLRASYDIALGDVNNDGITEIVTVPRASASAEVRYFVYRSGRLVGLPGTFTAHGAALRVGARISTVDINADGKDDVGLSLGSRSQPTINYYTLTNGKAIRLPANSLHMFSTRDRIIINHASGV
ncbi:MAG: FG-GAP-like repeat-containing protein [Patescibacteria group bacterium]